MKEQEPTITINIINNNNKFQLRLGEFFSRVWQVLRRPKGNVRIMSLPNEGNK